MAENVRDGKYLLGDLIEPKMYKKFVIEGGQIVEKTFTVEGRKIPLASIREATYKEHRKLGIVRTTEDKIIRRNFIIWGDHACVLNTGILIYTAKVLYSSETFYTDQEMKAQYGKDLDVQKLVEQPSIYIFASTSDSIADKLSYVESRNEDVELLKASLKTDDNHALIDRLRFFQGKICICMKICINNSMAL